MECKCTLRGRLVGDGCDVCNPAKSLEYAKERIADDEATIERLRNALIAAESGFDCICWMARHDSRQEDIWEYSRGREQDARKILDAEAGTIPATPGTTDEKGEV